MTFDGFFTKKIIDELNNELTFGRINKINNISHTDFIFSIRKNTNKKMLISINPKAYRVHLTNLSYENPKSPSNFCTLLRKYLNNAIIENFSQVSNDRIITIKLRNTDDLGYKKIYFLIIELMGKHSNIILTDENKIIIDASNNSYNIEYKRATISNMTYQFPPTKEKINPFDFSLYHNLAEENFNSDFLLHHFYGVSKLLAKNFTNINEFKNFCLNFEQYNKPAIIKENHKDDFYFFNINQDPNAKYFNSNSELLDFYYLDTYKNDNNKKHHKAIYDFVKNKINKLNHKLERLEKELYMAQSNHLNELKGNLLLANLYLYQSHVPNEVILQNFYSENLENITITLDAKLSIEKNAENYFKESKKNKRSISNIENQIELSKAELTYFDTINIQLVDADISDIEEIIEELRTHHYIKVKEKKKSKKINLTKINYKGIDIYIGKNNIQNDYITNKLAKKSYTWLHAKNIPGSHVVIFSDHIDNEILLVAANLAGYYSKFKQEVYVDVDYTPIKYVKKIQNSKPGLVTYTNQSTITVKIDKNLISSLINS